jgi:hypothetical protein
MRDGSHGSSHRSSGVGARLRRHPVIVATLVGCTLLGAALGPWLLTDSGARPPLAGGRGAGNAFLLTATSSTGRTSMTPPARLVICPATRRTSGLNTSRTARDRPRHRGRGARSTPTPVGDGTAGRAARRAAAVGVAVGGARDARAEVLFALHAPGIAARAGCALVRASARVGSSRAAARVVVASGVLPADGRVRDGRLLRSGGFREPTSAPARARLRALHGAPSRARRSGSSARLDRRRHGAARAGARRVWGCGEAASPATAETDVLYSPSAARDLALRRGGDRGARDARSSI